MKSKDINRQRAITSRTRSKSGGKMDKGRKLKAKHDTRAELQNKTGSDKTKTQIVTHSVCLKGGILT